MRYLNYCDNGLREIVTQATVARGEKRCHHRHTLMTDYKIDMLLGYTCKNHVYSAEIREGAVLVKGKYDVHIWYSFHNGTQTAVMKETVHYTENIGVTNLDGGRVGRNETADVELIREPVAVDAYIAGSNELNVVVEMAYSAEIVGDARLWIKVFEAPIDWDDKKYFEDAEGLEFEFEDLEEFEIEEPK